MLLMILAGLLKAPLFRKYVAPLRSPVLRRGATAFEYLAANVLFLLYKEESAGGPPQARAAGPTYDRTI